MGPSDFHLYGPLERLLAGKWFALVNNMKPAVTYWLQTCNTDFISAGMQALLPWLEECFSISSGHVEVWCVPSVTGVPCICWSLNKVLGIGLFGTLFFEIYLYVTLKSLSSVGSSGPITRLLHALLWVVMFYIGRYIVNFRCEIIKSVDKGV